MRLPGFWLCDVVSTGTDERAETDAGFMLI